MPLRKFSKNKTRCDKKVGGGVLGDNKLLKKPKQVPTDEEILSGLVDEFFAQYNGTNSDETIKYAPITYTKFLAKNKGIQGINEEDISIEFKEITGNKSDTNIPITKELYEKYVKNNIKFQNLLIKLFANLQKIELITSIDRIKKEQLMNKFVNLTEFKNYFGILDGPCQSTHASQKQKKNVLEGIFKSISGKKSFITFKDFVEKCMENPEFFRTLKEYDMNTVLYEDKNETDAIMVTTGGKTGGKNKSRKQIRKRNSNKKKSNKRR